MLPTFVVLVIGVVAILYARGGDRAIGTLERLFVPAAFLPFACSIVVPLIIGLAWGYGPSSKWWIDGFSWAGVLLSFGLGLVGLVLAGRAARQGRRWAWPLGGAVVVAASPGALMLLYLIVFWGLARLL